MASIGTAKIARSTPHIQNQNTSDKITSAGFKVKRGSSQRVYLDRGRGYLVQMASGETDLTGPDADYRPGTEAPEKAIARLGSISESKEAADGFYARSPSWHSLYFNPLHWSQGRPARELY